MSMVNGSGAIDFSVIGSHLEIMTIEKVGKLLTLGDIKRIFNKSLVISTYNWTDRAMEYLTDETHADLPCLVALRQTSSLPLLFPPYKYMGKFYLDGGLYENFPIQYKLDEEDKHKRLGITVDDNIHNEMKDPSEYSFTEYLYHILTIPVHQNLLQLLKTTENVDIIRVETSLNAFHFHLDTKELLNLFSVGHQQARSFFTQK